MSYNSNRQGGGWDNYNNRGPAARGGNGAGGSAGTSRGGTRGGPPRGRFHAGRNNRGDRYHHRYNHPYYQQRENDQRTYGHDGRPDTYASGTSSFYYGNATADAEVDGGGEARGYHQQGRNHHVDNNSNARIYHHDDRTWKKTKTEDMEAQPITSSSTSAINDKLRYVNMETWDSFSDKEHFESQYPDNFRNYASVWELIEKRKLIGSDRMLSEEWLEHKKKAANIVIEKKRNEFRKQVQDRDYDSDSSDDMSMFVNGARPIGAPADYATQLDPGFVKFMKALPYNVVFDVGFHMIGMHQKDEESCFCPCSKMKMIKWRTNFGVEHIEKKVERDECLNRVYTPNALMDHLSSIGTYLHIAIRDYLEIVYKEFWDYHTSHKALYKVGTKDYKRAEAAMNLNLTRISELEE